MEKHQVAEDLFLKPCSVSQLDQMVRQLIEFAQIVGLMSAVILDHVRLGSNQSVRLRFNSFLVCIWLLHAVSPTLKKIVRKMGVALFPERKYE